MSLKRRVVELVYDVVSWASYRVEDLGSYLRYCEERLSRVEDKCPECGGKKRVFYTICDDCCHNEYQSWLKQHDSKRTN